MSNLENGTEDSQAIEDRYHSFRAGKEEYEVGGSSPRILDPSTATDQTASHVDETVAERPLAIDNGKAVAQRIASSKVPFHQVRFSGRSTT